VVLSGLKWPDSSGNFNSVAGGFLHYLHSTKLSEIWHICTATNARRSGVFSIWTPTGRSTTNRPACAPMIQTFMHLRGGYGQPGFGNTFWGLLVDAACAGIIIWVVSGLIMWWRLPRLRTWGTIAVAARILSFTLLVGTL